MHRTILTLTAAALFAVPAAAQMKAGATATIRDASGKSLGTASAHDHGGGMLMVEIKGRGMPTGTRAVHVHAVGKCEAATKFGSAGPHWNPMDKQHGRQNPMGAHEGDMPNLMVPTGGTVRYSAMIPDASLAGLLDADGGAIVVHEMADDYRTDPTGNAGGRIACGVFKAK